MEQVFGHILHNLKVHRIDSIGRADISF